MRVSCADYGSVQKSIEIRSYLPRIVNGPNVDHHNKHHRVAVGTMYTSVEL